MNISGDLVILEQPIGPMRIAFAIKTPNVMCFEIEIRDVSNGDSEVSLVT